MRESDDDDWKPLGDAKLLIRGARDHAKGVVIYCPGRWQGGGYSCSGDTGDIRNQLWLNDFAILTLRYPSAIVGNDDAAPTWLKNYDLASHVRFVDLALDFAGREFPSLPIFLVGFSIGGAFALLGGARASHRPAAIVALDSGLVGGTTPHERIRCYGALENPVWEPRRRRLIEDELARRRSGHAPRHMFAHHADADLCALLAMDRWWPAKVVFDLAQLRSGRCRKGLYLDLAESIVGPILLVSRPPEENTLTLPTAELLKNSEVDVCILHNHTHMQFTCSRIVSNKTVRWINKHLENMN